MSRRSLLAGLAALCVVVGAGHVEAQSPLGAPTVGAITATTNELTVPWTAPSDDGGAAIIAYDLRYIRTDATPARKAVDANWTVEEVWTTGGVSLETEVKDLPDGVEFDVQLRAENASEIGPWSATGLGSTTDHGDTISSATSLTLGGSAIGRIEPADEEDVFRLVLTSAADLWVYADGELDSVGELLDSTGDFIARDDQGYLLDARDGFSLRREVEAGTYYVRVISHRGFASGSYTIHSRAVTDPGDAAATAATVTLDSVTPGRIDEVDLLSENDRDYFQLVLNSDAEIWVMAVGDVDSYGELLRENESVVTEDDDSGFPGNGLGFMLRRELMAGTYYIRVTGVGLEPTGPYALYVRTVADPGNTTATAAPLTLGAPETGRISSLGDRDYFSLTLAKDTYVYVHALTFGDALPLQATVFDDTNTEVSLTQVLPHSTWSEHGRSEVSFSLWGKLDAGSYHIRVQRFDSRIGSYLLFPVASPYNQALERCTGLTTPESDPWYGCQWHLSNTSQFPGGAGHDINVESVWAGGNRGDGIHIALVDDGLQHTHPDLSENVIAARNHDYEGRNNVFDPLETHGTAVAGLIAALDNDIGGRGVAPEASIYAYNLIADDVSLFDHEVDAMTRHMAVTAVSNNSWGWVATGLPRGARAAWESAVERGVTEGFGGKGIVYVWAAGNGHEENNNSNFDGFTNFHAVTAVCAVGYDDRRSDYSEMGANLWICAPSNSGRYGLPEIATTHQVGRYREDFGGTSAATPIVSGVVALMRAANADLTWRDVKLILAASARRNDSGNSGWEQGALRYGSTTGRYSFNHEYGFGMVDAAAAVALADGWTRVPGPRESEAGSGVLDLAIPDAPDVGSPTSLTDSLTLDSHVAFVEFMEIEITLEHDWFRDLRIELVSPTGAVSVLSVPALSVLLGGSFDGSHRFGSARHLGENAEGTWTLRVTDTLHTDTGTLTSWKLTAYGHGYLPTSPDIDDVVPGPGSITVTWKQPQDIGASDITSYDLRYIRDDATDFADGRWTEVLGVGSLTDLQYTASGLDGDTKYRVALRARNADGTGPWSVFAAEETQQAVPGAPRSVSAAARAAGLAVSWRLPGYAGAGTPTSYDLRYIRSDALDKADAFWSVVSFAWRTGDGDLRDVIRGLDNGVGYDVQVLARNDAGAGAWSPTATGMPAATNSRAEFPNSESGRRSVLENTPAGRDVGEPVAARDDEGDTLTYSLTAGAANFDIVAATGQLQTKVALDRERTASYAVTVAVHDGKNQAGEPSTATDDTIRVTIAIDDEDEPPVVTGSMAPVVQENTTTIATYRAQDPERQATTFTWSLAGPDAGAFMINDRGVLTFDPAPDFEAPTDSAPLNVYEVTIQATDESAVDVNARIGEFDVEVRVEGVDEPPEISGDSSVEFPENGPVRVGGYTASDPEGAAVSWRTLAGPEARYFTFDPDTGELSFAATPDFEARSSAVYRVTVRAADEGNRVGGLPVTVTLTPVPEPPEIGGPDEVTLNEVVNPTPGQVVAVGSYTRRDPEGSSTSWGSVGSATVLTGADAGEFDFDRRSGRLTFREPPDFESGSASYRVTLNANDGVLSGGLDVTVHVANLDEPGTVTLDRRTPIINRTVTATLEDADGVVSETWQWQRSPGRTGPWSDIATATSRSYAPVGDDRGAYLRASAEYEDGHGAGKTAPPGVSEFPAANDRASNTPPVLPDAVDDISLPENTPPGRTVATVRATDAENDPLTYSLAGASEFVIGRTNGQIRVAPGAAFDFDFGRTIYVLTVTARDIFDAADSVDVTITLTGVDEPPEAAPDAASTSEDEPVVIDVLSNDSDPEGADLAVTAVSRPGSGTATAGPGTGEITYTPRADYHGADGFRYTVSDGALRDEGTVSVTIRAVNDPPEFPPGAGERSVAESAGAGEPVGAPVAATDRDGDDPTYRLSGSADFEIAADSGQITVRAGTAFDVSIQETYTVTVVASDGNGGRASVEVTITVTTQPVGPTIVFGGGGGGGPSGPTPSDEDFEWTVKHDIEELDPGQDTPSGLWSDATTLWILENGPGSDDAIYAYALKTGERDVAREFALHETNRAPRGVWSNGETVWVSDSGQERLFAYHLMTGERQEEREVALAARNSAARGIWSDGEAMWVLDGVKAALFAYDLKTHALLGEYALDGANDVPHGVWSDRTTVWVSDHRLKRLLAYRLPARPAAPAAEDAEPTPLERISGEDFKELSKASNNSPRGLWSDGEVMYAADESDDRVYTYNMPGAIDARLASLTLSGVEIGDFDPGTKEYEGTFADGAARTTVEAGAAQQRAIVAVDPPDADAGAAGHQVSIGGGGEVTVTVTSADGSRRTVYRVRLGETAPEPCLRGEVAVGFSFLTYAGGSLEDLVPCAAGREVTALYTTHDGAFVPYTLGAPEFVSRSFRELYAGGLPAATPLLVKSDGPASPAAAGGRPRDGGDTQPRPECLRGEVASGFSIVVSRGGSVEELEACARSLGVATLYALDDGVWFPYIIGAPGFVNRSFVALYADGLSPMTPLVARSDGRPTDGPGRDDAAGG